MAANDDERVVIARLPRMRNGKGGEDILEGGWVKELGLEDLDAWMLDTYQRVIGASLAYLGNVTSLKNTLGNTIRTFSFLSNHPSSSI